MFSIASLMERAFVQKGGKTEGFQGANPFTCPMKRYGSPKHNHCSIKSPIKFPFSLLLFNMTRSHICWGFEKFQSYKIKLCTEKDLNSATRARGVGLVPEASKLLKMATANPIPLVAEFKTKFYFIFRSMVKKKL